MQKFFSKIFQIILKFFCFNFFLIKIFPFLSWKYFFEDFLWNIFATKRQKILNKGKKIWSETVRKTWKLECPDGELETKALRRGVRSGNQQDRAGDGTAGRRQAILSCIRLRAALDFPSRRMETNDWIEALTVFYFFKKPRACPWNAYFYANIPVFFFLETTRYWD